MSEHADKYSNSHRKERVDHILNSTKGGKVDASGYEVPGELDPGRKTGPEQPKPRKFAKGGAVEGHKAHHHAGRKSRDMGGQTAVQQLRPQVPTGGLYGSGFQPTHAGMMSSAAGLKKGGAANRHKRDGGGPVGEAVQQAKANRAYADAHNAGVNAYDNSLGVRPSGSSADARAAAGKASDAMGAMYDSSDRTGYPAGLKKGGMAKKAKGGGIANEVTGVRITGDRKARADGGSAQRHNGESKAEFRIDEQERTARKDGGRAKGKTNINIIIGGPKEAPGAGAVPPPPSAMPPKPPLPPGAMGAMQPPGMGGMPPGAAPGGGGGMPPQMPPGMAGR